MAALSHICSIFKPRTVPNLSELMIRARTMTWQMARSFISGVTTRDLPPVFMANVLRIYHRNFMQFKLIFKS